MKTSRHLGSILLLLLMGGMAQAQLTVSNIQVGAGPSTSGSGFQGTRKVTTTSDSPSCTSDLSKQIIFTNTSPIAVTLPQATGSCGTSVVMWLTNTNTGTVTISPTTSTITCGGLGGQTSCALLAGQTVTLTSDGTNWYASYSSTRYYTALTSTQSTTSPGPGNRNLLSTALVRPANLPVGTRIHLYSVGTYDSQSNTNLSLEYTTGATSSNKTACDGDLLTVSSSSHTNPYRWSWSFDCEITVRATGSGGTAYMTARNWYWNADSSSGYLTGAMEGFSVVDDSTHSANGYDFDDSIAQNYYLGEWEDLSAISITIRAGIYYMEITLPY